MNRNHRRGLSSVVGAVFMVLVMVAAFNVMLIAMQQQDKVTQAVLEKSSSNLGKLNEEISISEIKVTSLNKLNMTVTNSGGTTAKLVSLYVVNETAKEQFRYDLNNVPVDGRASRNIDDLALTLKSNTKYSVKVVTAAGNTATSGITPISSAALPMSLTVIPPTIPPGQNVTVLFTVTNNITDSALGWPVSAIISHDCTSLCVLTPDGSQPPSTIISPGTTALFKWTWRVESTTPDERLITFNASLTNAKQGNFVLEQGLVKIIETSETTIVVNEELISRPEIFLLVPGPYGNSASDDVLWGIVVVNPTSEPMEVSRVWMAAYTSIAAANQKFFIEGPGDSCTGAQYIYPTSGWSCPHDNLIMWVDTSTPVSIPGYGIVSFLMRQEPGTLTSGDEPGFNLNVGVYTSLGQFAKTGISSTMADANQPLASIYLTDTLTPSGANSAISNNHMFGHKLAIPENNLLQEFRIAFADLDEPGATYIKNGTKLIVNVPPGFDNVLVNCVTSVGFFCNPLINEPKYVSYSDDSTQIIATINGNLGATDATSPYANILVFTTRTPDVTGTKVYIMHVLADGETNVSNWSVSPLAQIALQVVDT